jgi:hypothetical protein
LTKTVFKKANTDFLSFWEIADQEVPQQLENWKAEKQDKVQILSWKVDGMFSLEIYKQSGRHRASIDHLYVKLKGLPLF